PDRARDLSPDQMIVERLPSEARARERFPPRVIVPFQLEPSGHGQAGAQLDFVLDEKVLPVQRPAVRDKYGEITGSDPILRTPVSSPPHERMDRDGNPLLEFEIDQVHVRFVEDDVLMPGMVVIRLETDVGTVVEQTGPASEQVEPGDVNGMEDERSRDSPVFR